MKKFLIIFSCILGLAGFSMGAQANGKPLAAGGSTSLSKGTGGDCQSLSENVNINTSTDVQGYVDCPDAYTVSVGTCHAAGRLTSADNAYIYNGSSAGGSITADTSSGKCTAANVKGVAEGSS